MLITPAPKTYALPMTRTLITAPATEPVTVVEARDWCRATTDDDTFLTGAIITARSVLEQQLRRVFVTQTWDCYWDIIPASPFLLFPNPVQSVTAAYATNDAGVEAAITAATYWLDAKSVPARLTLADDQEWPEAREWMALRVRIVAGYGAAADVPQPIKQAILMAVGYWYRYREATQKLPQAAFELVQGYQVPLRRHA